MIQVHVSWWSCQVKTSSRSAILHLKVCMSKFNWSHKKGQESGSKFWGTFTQLPEKATYVYRHPRLSLLHLIVDFCSAIMCSCGCSLMLVMIYKKLIDTIHPDCMRTPWLTRTLIASHRHIMPRASMYRFDGGRCALWACSANRAYLPSSNLLGTRFSSIMPEFRKAKWVLIRK